RATRCSPGSPAGASTGCGSTTRSPRRTPAATARTPTRPLPRGWATRSSSFPTTCARSSTWSTTSTSCATARWSTAGPSTPGAAMTERAAAGTRVVRYSERPELWDAIEGLSSQIWPEYNMHGDVLNAYWGRLYDEFARWQFVVTDAGDGQVLAEGNTIPV